MSVCSIGVRFSVAAIFACGSASAVAQSVEWDFALETGASSVEVGATIDSDFGGFLIGDFDAETNPGGTQTRPGLFGGSGNQPIDLSLGFGLGVDIDANGAGMFASQVNLEEAFFSVDGLEMDLLAGGTGSFPVTLSLLFETFRTFAPDSLFIGGFPLEVPVGAGTIESFTLAQTAESFGTLTATKIAGTYDAAIIIPVELTVAATLSELPVDVPPIPAVLPVAGTLVIDGDVATFTLVAAASIDETLEGPFEGVGFDALPFPLPTIIPPGDTANLLMTAELETVGTLFDIDLALVATGNTVDTGPVGDVDGNGVVNFQDIVLLLGAWGTCTDIPECPADIDGDSIVGFADLLLVLNNFSG